MGRYCPLGTSLPKHLEYCSNIVKEVCPSLATDELLETPDHCLNKTTPSLWNACPADPAQLFITPDPADLSRKLGMGDLFLERWATLGAFFAVIITTAIFQPFLEPDGFALEPRSKESALSLTLRVTLPLKLEGIYPTTVNEVHFARAAVWPSAVGAVPCLTKSTPDLSSAQNTHEA